MFMSFLCGLVDLRLDFLSWMKMEYYHVLPRSTFESYCWPWFELKIVSTILINQGFIQPWVVSIAALCFAWTKRSQDDDENLWGYSGSGIFWSSHCIVHDTHMIHIDTLSFSMWIIQWYTHSSWWSLIHCLSSCCYCFFVVVDRSQGLLFANFCYCPAVVSWNFCSDVHKK
jgi:hypothetical protein